MSVYVKVKRWGNSFGVVIPKETAEELAIHENEEVEIEIKKSRHLSEFYGALKGKKIAFSEEDRLDVR
jgi:bifunctional DNA-binding transcriptional regulator/antitoxin component of YhaV-PrlF toxin-antitoxin module